MPGQRTPPGRLLGWAAIAVLSAYCLFIGGGWAGIYFVDLRILSLVLTATVLGAWAVVAVRDPAWRPRSALVPAFVAAVAAFAISIATSRYPRLGVEYLAWAVLLAALYLLLQRLMASAFFRPRLVAFGAIAAVAIGIAYVVVVVARWMAWWDIVGAVVQPPLRPAFEGLTFGNPSAVLTVTSLLTAATVGHIWDGSGRRAVVCAAMVLLAAFVALLAGSRAGWLAIAVAIVAVGTAWLVSAGGRRTFLRYARSRATQALAVVVGLFGIGAIVVTAPGILLRAGAGGDQFRAAFYAASVRMFESSPLVGTGPGTWAPLRTPFTVAPDVDYYIPHAHNIYLQTMAEFGLLGVAAGAVALFCVGRLLVRAIRSEDPTRRRVGWLALLATVYFAAHQMLDFYANAPAVLFAFAIPIAWLDATEPTPGDRARAASAGRWRWGAAAAGGVGVVGAIALLAWSEIGALRLQDGTALLNSGDVAAAVQPLKEAADGDAAMPPYRLVLGIALADIGDLASAEAELLASATVDDLPEAWLDVAAVRQALGDRAGADDAIDRALRLGDQQTAIVLGVGALELEQGHRSDAISAFAEALDLGPSLAADPWWTAEPARAAVWPEAYARAFAQADPGVAFELALQSGNAAGVATSIDRLDADSRATAELVAAAWSGHRDAVAKLEAQARADPLTGSLTNWLIRIYDHLGDASRAADYASWSDIVSARSDVAPPRLRIAATPTAPDAGATTSLYGFFEYRRHVPANLLVNWLPRLESKY